MESKDNLARQPIVLGITSLAAALICRKRINASLRLARNGWRNDPIRMSVKIILSLLTGQVVFWKYGYDQLGFFMNPKFQVGTGQSVAEKVSARIPKNTAVAWTIKALEIATDAGKIPIEGAVYQRHGFVSDVVAGVVTQPLWSALETAEKVSGVILHPERVKEPEQVKLSLGCIYGSLFRYLLAGMVWLLGDQIYRFLGRPMEKGLRRAVNSTNQNHSPK